MQRRSLIEYFAEFRRHGAAIAYAQPNGYRTARWSYREVFETACQFAWELEARELGAGDRVVLWGRNSAEWVAAFIGCVLRGAVVVPLDEIASRDFALRVCHQVSAKLLVTSGERASDFGVASLALEQLRESVAHHSSAQYSSPELAREDIVEVVFTSGTTAEPKGVLISHGNILANLEPLEAEIQKYRKYERLVHPLRFLNLLPLSHLFGQFLGMLVPPLLGATVVFQESLNPSEIIRAMKRERVSVLVAVPRVLESLQAKIERDFESAGQQEDFRRQLESAADEHFIRRWWRFRKIHGQFGWKFWAIISGGAALPPETEEFWRRLGFAVIQGYGLTETTSLVSVNHPMRLGKGSIGKVLPGREIKLDETGEILVRGESVAAGYWEGNQRRPAPHAGEWFHTGDIGELDASGNLYFKGRKKNVIVTPAGMNVYPEDLEAALRRQAEVRDCVVVGLARDGNAEPCAVLLLRDPRSDPAAVVQRANASLADYQRMHHWFVWPEEDFPRTGTQKPRLGAITQAVERRLRAPIEQAQRSELAELVARVSGRAPARFSADTHLESDLSLSSLDRVELLSAIEDRYQIDLNESSIQAATTVRELEQLLHQVVPRRSEYIYPRWAQRWPTTWVRLAFYYLVLWPATLLLGYPRIKGRENPREVSGPILIVSNHVTSIDVGFILAALPARFRHRLAVAMGAERLQTMRHPPPEVPFLERMLDRMNYWLVVALMNVFPLPQQSGFRESFLFAGESVDRGYSVLVFPEGELTKNGKLGRFRRGIGLLANNLKIPVVPVRIDGLFELKQAGKRIARPGEVRVTIGAPVDFAADADPERIVQELEARVAALNG